jgi:bifunctional non-homologous end joining protein LigD
MGLSTYHKKRDFSKTQEPKAGKSSNKTLKFVVQRHHASHLHYDFRLEMDGVLKSWAIPKGPSLNPKDKRLAMMVEDHPYDYRTFEGVIPKGNYGGGVVNIFDSGTYTALANGTIKDLHKGLHTGNLKFKLNGKILKGEFALVKIKSEDDSNAWLLIKHRDEYAVDTKFNSEDLVNERIKKEGIAFKQEEKPKKEVVIAKSQKVKKETKINDTYYKPMLAKLASKVFEDEDWVYEKKYDGYRSISSIIKGNPILKSRNGIDFTEKYAPITETLKKLKVDAILDGELVIEDKNGESSFQLLQNYNPEDQSHIIKYYVFDLLYLNGHDTREMDLVKRKELLKKVISALKSKTVIYSEHVIAKGEELFKKAKKMQWEGIIGKKASSIYTNNKRTDYWLKFKITSSQEAIIIGYTSPSGSRKHFGALVLAMYNNKKLIYIGNCGTGFNEQSLADLLDRLKPLETNIKPVHEKVNLERNVTWVKPELVCEVTFSEWTDDKHLRHPVFKGLRSDKNKSEVVKEHEAETEMEETVKNDDKKNAPIKTKTRPVDEEVVYGKKKVKLTNQNKIFWPKEKITKGDLIDYYKNVAKFILPHLKDRPLSLNRHPNGITGPSFFQKDLDTDKIPSWIKSAPLHSESNNKDIDYLICNDEATLLWMVNLGCIEINPWLSKYKTPDQPMFAVLDLDPHDIDFSETIAVAKTTKTFLDKMKIKAFIKTSGSKGLHIFIPIGKNYDYDLSKNFIHYLGNLVHQQHPETTSLERSPSKRKNQIYLDFLQNRKGQTIAAPYSVRPKPGATVSMPLHWDEIKDGLKISNFTISNSLERLNKTGDLWEGIEKINNDLKSALTYLKA